jgi:hypothetical protein
MELLLDHIRVQKVSTRAMSCERRSRMMTNERSTIVGVFEMRSEADAAIHELQRAGFRDDQIGFVAHSFMLISLPLQWVRRSVSPELYLQNGLPLPPGLPAPRGA